MAGLVARTRDSHVRAAAPHILHCLGDPMRDFRIPDTLGAVCLSTLVACSTPLPAGGTAATPRAGVANEIVVPARYDEGRWIVRPVTARGDTLDLYTDTGGGVLFIARERLGPDAMLSPGRVTPQGDSSFTTTWPSMPAGSAFPRPFGDSSPQVMTASSAAFRRLAGGFPARDGFLGNEFFAHHIWVFDYPAHVLGVLPAGTAPMPLGGSTIPFTFKADAGKGDEPWFPRIRVEIDGDSLDLLFDTGATTELTDSAAAKIGDGRPRSRAASFITRTVAERWQTRHPDWRVVKQAEVGTSADMIEVPHVTVAGLTSGPVWFTIRPDPNFTTYMSKWMDQPIVGAFGGSGLRYFRVIADYPNQRATFSLPGK